MIRRLATYSALVALVAPAMPQNGAALPIEARYVHPWHESGTVTTLAATKARALRFDPASGIDLVVLRSLSTGPGPAPASAFTLRDVGRAHACYPLGAVVDFETVPCADGTEGVLTLASDGSIRLLRWQAGQPAPSSQVIGFWPGFRRLAVVRAGSSTHVFGFDSANSRIRRATWSGSQLGLKQANGDASPASTDELLAA
jgi:hypothetical protein